MFESFKNLLGMNKEVDAVGEIKSGPEIQNLLKEVDEEVESETRRQDLIKRHQLSEATSLEDAERIHIEAGERRKAKEVIEDLTGEKQPAEADPDLDSLKSIVLRDLDAEYKRIVAFIKAANSELQEGHLESANDQEIRKKYEEYLPKLEETIEKINTASEWKMVLAAVKKLDGGAGRPKGYYSRKDLDAGQNIQRLVQY